MILDHGFVCVRHGTRFMDTSSVAMVTIVVRCRWVGVTAVDDAFSLSGVFCRRTQEAHFRRLVVIYQGYYLMGLPPRKLTLIPKYLVPEVRELAATPSATKWSYV